MHGTHHGQSDAEKIYRKNERSESEGVDKEIFGQKCTDNSSDIVYRIARLNNFRCGTAIHDALVGFVGEHERYGAENHDDSDKAQDDADGEVCAVVAEERDEIVVVLLLFRRGTPAGRRPLGIGYRSGFGARTARTSVG